MDRSDLPALQSAAGYLAFKKRLQFFGCLGLVLSIAYMAGGIVAMLGGQEHWLFYAAAGMVFFINAVWDLKAPNAVVFGVTGVLFVLGGIYSTSSLLSAIMISAETAVKPPPIQLLAYIVPAMFIWGRWSIVYALALQKMNFGARTSPAMTREVAAAVD